MEQDKGQTHTHSGLNAYLLANLKDRFLKKQTKKDKIKKEIKKTQQDGMWISRWGVGTPVWKSRSARVESQTRRPAPALCSPHPCHPCDQESKPALSMAQPTRVPKGGTRASQEARWLGVALPAAPQLAGLRSEKSEETPI